MLHDWVLKIGGITKFGYGGEAKKSAQEMFWTWSLRIFIAFWDLLKFDNQAFLNNLCWCWSAMWSLSVSVQCRLRLLLEIRISADQDNLGFDIQVLDNRLLSRHFNHLQEVSIWVGWKWELCYSKMSGDILQTSSTLWHISTFSFGLFSVPASASMGQNFRHESGYMVIKRFCCEMS